MLETERLYLRQVRKRDTLDLLEYHGDAEVVRYIPWMTRSAEEVALAIDSYESFSSSLQDEGDSIVLGWEVKSTGKVIGQSNASLVSLVNQTADIGWVTNRMFWRQGYAYEATVALLKYLINQPFVNRVIANIDMRNPESALLAEKLGMRLEGEFIKSTFTKGEWCDMWLYAMLREDF
jgi:aminoglycoside 6'-N-acetyltransferase